MSGDIEESRVAATHTRYDLVKTIAGSSTRTFAYSPDRSRYKMVRTAANNTTETTYTFGHIEILLDSAGALKETRRYLPGGTLITDKPSAAPAISYLLKDHLGSLDVIVDDYGNIVQELSFDAWGLRRDTASWVNLDPIPMVFFNTSITRKGFTGHEMLDDVGIIDMGGRIYDPRLGRFLQADPFIQAPMNSQSHNRYSYVLNNPLVNVDPSGFFLKKLFSKIGRFLKKVWKNPYVRMAVAIVAAIYTFNAALFAENIIANAAAVGFVSGGIMTGSLKGAVMGALTGAVTGAIGDLGLGDFTHFAQGLGGGVMSDLQGGKFGHGFVSAGAGSYMGGVDIADGIGRYVTAALVG
ncbi:MAG TPA: RHS repeat-associated core domain-containing protein, partial [Spongiibacteraceae bacterium]|nr:RHS repeat-associated core domain-containing protein [Spongiibacteraceae bacterium]